MAATSVRLQPIPLLRFIPALQPRWQSPTHLAPIANLFERSLHEPVRGFGTTPPRHGKTECLKFGIVHRLLARPADRIGFASYGARYAQKRSREIRKLYQKAGGRLERGAALVADWRTGIEDGGLWAAGIDGGWTGEGMNLIIVDDPIKGRAEAESALERQKLWDAFVDDIETRLEPGGSIIVIHTRWHVDDLGGRLLARGDWEHIHLPAIDLEGRALWPERFPVEKLREIESQKGAYTWASLYMGQPFPRGGRVFDDCQLYDLRPVKLRVSLGLDCAYSTKSHADYSVLVVVGADDSRDPVVYYVLDVIRVQEPVTRFAERVRAVQKTYPAAPTVWYRAGVEKGIADFMRDLGVDVEDRTAAADKFVRAQPVAAAWNGRRILVPRSAPWVDEFVGELAAFTGVGDLHDDQVDGFAAAFDGLEQPDWVHAMQRWKAGGAGR